MREVVGFLNSRDGVLLIGVSDAQIVTGVECDGFEGNGDKYNLKINDVIRSAIGDAATASCVKINFDSCLLYTSPSPRDRTRSRMPSSA